jgi:hypothetical protein
VRHVTFILFFFFMNLKFIFAQHINSSRGRVDSTATACPRGPLAKFYGQYPPVCDKEFSVTVIKYISSVSVGMETKTTAGILTKEYIQNIQCSNVCKNSRCSF